MARSQRRGRRRGLVALVLAGLTVVTATAAPPQAQISPWARLASAAGRVVRGRCLTAEPIIVAVAGGRVEATEYTWSVSETLKGPPATTLRFRQVGRPAGGRGDLGALVGLPVYAPGVEYVLFLLPESRSRLTSPVDAAGGAFLLLGENLVASGRSHSVITPRGEAKAGSGALTYSSLRAALQAGSAP